MGFLPNDWKVGDKCYYNHDGEQLPAEVTKVTETGGVQLKIQGWLGNQFIMEKYNITRRT